ncbi:MAG TPA: response regulator [Ferruginibacter sp.]|nr:response regulator [Ferruginibacter sp.]HMP22149.1 response regulator [Ferruginibacter sp.]
MYLSDKPYSILIVEDNPTDFEIINDYLEECFRQFTATHLKTYNKAAEYLGQHANEVDIILLDLSLPDKDGEALVKAMLEKAGDIPVVIFTGNTNINFSIHSISIGVADYLIKDELTPGTLFKSIIYSIERKKINKQLQDSEKKFSDLFFLSPQPMLIFNPITKKIVQSNKAALELYQYNSEDFTGISFYALFDEPKYTELDDAETNDSIVYRGRYKHKNSKGEILVVDLYCRPLMHDGMLLNYITIVDLTEKLDAEERITRAIIKTQEEERYEIGTELHDNVCQLLAASQLFAGMLKSHLPREAMPLLHNTLETIDTVNKEIRNLSHQLAPAFFDETSVIEALQRLLNSFSGECGWKTTTYVDTVIEKRIFKREIQLNLYRILQEQLHNIKKHANASAVNLSLTSSGTTLRMHLQDNGTGFDAEKNNSKGIGLANMKRRAEILEGKFSLFSMPGKGCEIEVVIPIDNQS